MHAVSAETNCKGFLCYSGKCLHPRLQHDLQSDCPGLGQEDEYDSGKCTSLTVVMHTLSYSFRASLSSPHSVKCISVSVTAGRLHVRSHVAFKPNFIGTCARTPFIDRLSRSCGRFRVGVSNQRVE